MATKTWAGRVMPADRGATTGASGRAAGATSRQAAHLTPARPLDPPCSPSMPTAIVWTPSAEQKTMGWPGTAAAKAANGIRLANVIANVAARKASERMIDQLSAWERVTRGP